MKRHHILLSTLALALAVPASASAAFTVSKDGDSGTLTGDGAADSITVTVDGSGDVVHGLTGGGLASTKDWDPASPGEQTIAAAAGTITITGGDGDDNLAFGPGVTVLKAILNGGAGNDLLTAANGADDLRGDAGNDRLVGVRGDDDMEGGDGNDTLVWNNGDGSDVMDGEAGNDGVEVNGAPTAGDQFTIKPNGQRVRFDRVNLGQFNLDVGSTERMEVNGLGGADTMTVDPGLGTLLLTLSGGVGADTITGGDTHELILGGDENDTLTGGAGDDRIVGDRGADTFKGGAGDDTLVWNNGDGSDVMDGEDGLDSVEVNGAVAQGDAFTIAPNGQRTKFDRTNLGPFTLDIATAEVLALNGLGGDDTFQAADGTPLALIVDGGSGNDTIAGAGLGDSLRGGSGNDTITGGAGLDALDGQTGDDRIEARDGAADVVRCGDGTDTAIADQPRVDALDGCETVDRLPEAATRGKATLKRVSVRRRSGRQQVSFEISCTDAPCAAVVVSVLTNSRVKVRGVRARMLLGERRLSLAPGETRTFRLSLPRRAERAAKRRLIARMVYEGVTTQKRLRTR